MAIGEQGKGVVEGPRPLGGELAAHDQRTTARQALRQRTIVQPELLESPVTFSADPRGYVKTFPPEASKLFGWSPTEVIGKKRGSLFHKPEALKGLLPQFMKLSAERVVLRATTTMVRKDKSEFQAALRVTPVYQGDDFVGFRAEVRRLAD